MSFLAKKFFNNIKNKTVAFIGIGVSHIYTIKMFARKGIKTIALDRRLEDKFDAALLAEFKDLGVSVRLGEYDLLALDADIIFRTPGMYYLSDELASLRKRGTIVTSEMEVFFQLCPCTAFAVTGSDGKTTTTTLIAEMLKASGKTVHLGGNIGVALLPQIEDISPDDYAVVELSSFQLLSMRPAPDVAVITNITPNHLDVHASMEEYIDAKKNIFIHQNAFSKTILSADCPITNGFKDQVRGQFASFSLNKPVENGAYLKGDILTLVNWGEETPLFSKNDIMLPGMHNVANYLTAISAVKDYVDASIIHNIAKTFGGVEHRIEFVRKLLGVKWYNDSIATSPNRAIAGLRSFDDKVILLAGGYDKKLPFEPLAPEVIKHVKLLILAGPTSAAIKSAIIDHPDYNRNSLTILDANNMEDLVNLAFKHSESGDTVILSPASTSFDAYDNFEQRGRHYKDLVNNLKPIDKI